MLITPNELADLIEKTTAGAVPTEINYSRIIASQIRKRDRGAHLYSDGSKSLHSMINASQRELGEMSINRLSQVEIYSDEAAYINSIPCLKGQVKQIIVFEGLKHFIQFHTDLIWVLNLLQIHRPDAQYILPNGSIVAESLAFSVAGYSILSDYQKDPKTLVTIHDMLGPKARGYVTAALCGSICFLLLHELAHIELGHLKNCVYSERQHYSLLQKEELNSIKEKELAADEFAISLIPLESRAAFMPGLIFSLGGFAFIEVFSGNLSENHPLAVNRLSLIVDHCEASPENKAIVTSWIQSQRNSYQKFSNARQSSGGSIKNRIEESMPVLEAYKVLMDIKKRVSIEHGFLEAD